jgi:hypothetical protein
MTGLGAGPYRSSETKSHRPCPACGRRADATVPRVAPSECGRERVSAQLPLSPAPACWPKLSRKQASSFQSGSSASPRIRQPTDTWLRCAAALHKSGGTEAFHLEGRIAATPTFLIDMANATQQARLTALCAISLAAWVMAAAPTGAAQTEVASAPQGPGPARVQTGREATEPEKGKPFNEQEVIRLICRSLPQGSESTFKSTPFGTSRTDRK